MTPPRGPSPHEMDNQGEHGEANVTLTCNCFVATSGQNSTRIPLNVTIEEGSLGQRCDPFARSSCRRQCVEMVFNHHFETIIQHINRFIIILQANNATYFLDSKTVSANESNSEPNGMGLNQYLCELAKRQDNDTAVVITSTLSCEEVSNYHQLMSQRVDMTALTPHESSACSSQSTAPHDGLAAIASTASATA